MTAGRPVRPSRSNLLIRSGLTSFALLLLALPAAAVVGGFFPRLPVVTGFGRLLVTNLPWLAIGAGVALVMALIASRLGGGRFTGLLAALSLLVFAGNLVVGAQFAALAASHGASYDPIRQAQSPLPVGRGADERVVFAEVEGEQLHAEIWRAQPVGGLAAGAARGGVLFVHGGSFMHGSPGIRPPLFAFLADEGYTVVDIAYRLAPPPRWQDAPADVLCALGWFQGEAAKYGVDPRRIAVIGDSAGGNLALIAAYAPGGASGLAPSCDVSVAPPAGVIATYPVADLAATWRDLHELGGETPFPEVYTGGSPTDVPERYTAASVAGFIRAGLPPTLIYTGVNDQLIRIERMRDFARAVRDAGSTIELVEVPFADHAFDGSPNGFGMQLEEVLYRDFLAGLWVVPP